MHLVRFLVHLAALGSLPLVAWGAESPPPANPPRFEMLQNYQPYMKGQGDVGVWYGDRAALVMDDAQGAAELDPAVMRQVLRTMDASFAAFDRIIGKNPRLTALARTETASSTDQEGCLGRWALALPNGEAGWLNLSQQGGRPHGELWSVGSPRRLANLHIEGDRVSFTRKLRSGPPRFVGGPPTGDPVACLHTATVAGDTMELVMHIPQATGNTLQLPFRGKRLPPLPPRPNLREVQFGEPINLFNGRNLDGWTLTDPNQINGWKAVDGELVNTTPKLDFQPFSRYGNLRLTRKFLDFRLTLEFNVPPGGNSGVYLRGVYEAQVVDRGSRMQGIQGVGAIFGRIPPSKNAGKAGGVWQTYDITLVDRHVTVILNGETVIDNQPLLGCTNGALQADDTVPGYLYLQGDHTAVRYRNLVLRPVKP